MDRKVKGITIMEVLVVMAIIAILASASILGLRSLVERQRLYSATAQTAYDIKEVRLRAVSSNMIWGVRFCRSVSQYKIFAVDPATVGGGCPRDANSSCTNDATTQRLVSLPPGVLPQADFYVLFDRRGYPLNEECNTGPVNIILRNSYGSRTVIVDSLGRIRYE